MDIQNQVSSLELSKKLKSLGVKQESCFAWVDSVSEPQLLSFHKPTVTSENGICAAFTVAELMDLFPHAGGRLMDVGITNVFLRRIGTGYTAECQGWGGKFENIHEHHEFDFHAANVLAKLYIYLIENKIVKP